MADKNRIYRKAALDRIASPDQLDEAAALLRPRDGLIVLVLLAVIAAGVAWLFLARLPTVVHASGLFAADGRFVQITAGAEGTLTELAVRAGQEVVAGDVLARISRPELALELELRRSNAADRQTEYDTRAAQLAELAAARAERATARRNALREQQAAATDRVAALEAQLIRDEGLFEKRLITIRNLQDTRTALDSARATEHEASIGLLAVEADETAALQQDARDLAAVLERVRTAEDDLAQVALRAAQEQVLTAPVSGRVIELRATEGARVALGMAIAAIETGGARVRLVAYVSPEDGKRVAPGMEVRVVPSTVRRAESGSLRATVRAVSEAPVSPQAMLAVLGNESLVTRFAGAGAPFEVIIELDRDAIGAPVWAAGKGPALVIGSGTLAEAEITVREDAPVALVLPALRERLALVRG